jgi:hypothetical protein
VTEITQADDVKAKVESLRRTMLQEVQQ